MMTVVGLFSLGKITVWQPEQKSMSDWIISRIVSKDFIRSSTEVVFSNDRWKSEEMGLMGSDGGGEDTVFKGFSSIFPSEISGFCWAFVLEAGFSGSSSWSLFFFLWKSAIKEARCLLKVFVASVACSGVGCGASDFISLIEYLLSFFSCSFDFECKSSVEGDVDIDTDAYSESDCDELEESFFFHPFISSKKPGLLDRTPTTVPDEDDGGAAFALNESRLLKILSNDCLIDCYKKKVSWVRYLPIDLKIDLLLEVRGLLFDC